MEPSPRSAISVQVKAPTLCTPLAGAGYSCSLRMLALPEEAQLAGWNQTECNGSFSGLQDGSYEFQVWVAPPLY